MYAIGNSLPSSSVCASTHPIPYELAPQITKSGLSKSCVLRIGAEVNLAFNSSNEALAALLYSRGLFFFYSSASGKLNEAQLKTKQGRTL